uniref:RNase H type-1 domain-containing protein n=1 Tax=Oryza nivara TaxID=4536 RepID=A0A0E0FYN9_ORYNI
MRNGILTKPKFRREEDICLRKKRTGSPFLQQNRVMMLPFDVTYLSLYARFNKMKGPVGKASLICGGKETHDAKILQIGDGGDSVHCVQKRRLISPCKCVRRKPMIGITTRIDEHYTMTFLHSSDAESCSDSFKGECDASFCEQTGKAKLAFVIFKEGKLVWAEVFHDVPCKSVMEAEALAVIALLFKLIDLNLLRGTVWTDNKVCYNVLNGEYEIKVDDPNRSLFLFLRSLRGRFESLTPVWKPRELLLIPDRLVSMVDDPLISNKRDGGKQISNTTNEIKESDESEDSICWVKADDEEAEIASFLEIMKTFSAHRLLIVVDNFEDKSPHYQKLIKDLSQKFYTCWMSKEGSVTIMKCDSSNTEEEETKRLVVMFGGTMALDEYIHQKNLCTVVLVKTSEIKLLRDAGIEEISAKTLLSFRNIKAKPVVPKKPREDEDLEKGGGGQVVKRMRRGQV